MSCHRTPPQPPPTFDIAPSSLLPETVDVLSRSRSLRDKIISSVTPATANFSNVLQPLIDHENEALSRLKVLTLFATVAEDPALRDASRAAEKLVFEAEAEAFMSEGIAKLVAVVFESWREGKGELDAQDQHFLKRRHGEYLRNGLGIKDGKQRVRFLNLVTELNSLLSLARKTLSEAEGGIWLSEDDLVGVPAAVLLSMKHRSDIDGAKKDRFCSFRKGHYVPVMRQCTSAKSRKKLYFAKQNQFKENVGRLQKILEIRDEIARILGFKNHAELKLEEKMTESIGDMEIQLSEWRERLQSIAQSEIQRMLKLKSQVLECTKSQQESQNPDNLYFWDWSFYSHLLKKDKYAVNTSKISEYFEVTQTLHNMLSIFDKLFGIKFKQTKGNVWQKDVVMYTVWDNELQGSSFLGHLYFDLFAREGKYEGAHHAMIQPSYTDGNGIRHHAADALICSFLKIAGQPTLMMMNEVRTMFHELGHCIHFLVSKARYGLYPSRDFIEIPSIMLENWIWIPEVLKSLGRHYSYLNEELHTLWKENGGLEQEETLSDTLIKDLLRTKNLNGAHDMLSQLHAAAFDLAIHTPPTHEAAKVMDTTDMWNRMKRDIVGLESDDEVAPGVGQAGFPHIFRKYDAGYFAYPLSRVWAADLYSSAFAADPMNSATGQRYRKIVLEPGAGVSEAGILKEFLGRNPSSEAYFAEIIEGVERG